MKKYLTRKIVMMCISVVMMGISVTLFKQSNFGTDPYTCMNLGISDAIHMSFGLLQLCINCLLLIFVFFLAKHLIHIGTLVNMAGVGFLVDIFSSIFVKLFGETVDSLPVRILLMLTGVVLLSLAASLYFTAGLGVAPYDAMSFIITERSKINYRWCRIFTDVLCTIIGFLLGSTVGVGTVITAFFMGPLVQLFNQKISVPLLNRGMDLE